jgi:hypothetical protein
MNIRHWAVTKNNSYIEMAFDAKLSGLLAIAVASLSR